jgi:protein SCO1
LLIRGGVRRGTAATSHGQSGDGLGDYGIVPDFSLTERSGAVVHRADLAGSPWFADFVYTRCDGSCPLLSEKMSRLEHALGGRTRLVSFSVDPLRDTPEALSAYADRFGASATSWLFLTGDVASLRRLVGEGFHLALADPPPGEPELAGTITHSEKIALVDANLRIRRYYDGISADWIDAALADLATVRGKQGA